MYVHAFFYHVVHSVDRVRGTLYIILIETGHRRILRGKLSRFRQRNKLVQNMTAELLTPGKVGVPFTVAELYDGEGIAVESAPHPSRIFYTRVPFEVKEGDILRAE